MMVHPMRAYQRARVSTATPEELIILLCEGLVRFTAGAAAAIEEGDWAQVGSSCEKATEILNHLRESLAETIAPELVASLDRTYAAWTLCLLRAQIARDAASMNALVPQMQGLLASWRTVAHAPTSVAS